MFNGNQNNNRTVNTNTTFLTWYGSDVKLVIGAWNEKLSLKFTPSSGKNDNGLTMYDRENELITSLTAEKALVFKDAIAKIVLPHIEANDDEEVSATVSLGESETPNALILERKKDSEGTMSLYLTFLKGLNPDGKAGDGTKIISYRFTTIDYMSGYDYTTGSGDQASASGQFDVFMSFLEKVSDLFPVAYHAEKHSKALSKFYADRYGNGNNNSNGGYSSGPSYSNNGAFDSFLEGEELPFK